MGYYTYVLLIHLYLPLSFGLVKGEFQTEPFITCQRLEVFKNSVIIAVSSDILPLLVSFSSFSLPNPFLSPNQ